MKFLLPVFPAFAVPVLGFLGWAVILGFDRGTLGVVSSEFASTSFAAAILLGVAWVVRGLGLWASGLAFLFWGLVYMANLASLSLLGMPLRDLAAHSPVAFSAENFDAVAEYARSYLDGKTVWVAGLVTAAGFVVFARTMRRGSLAPILPIAMLAALGLGGKLWQPLVPERSELPVWATTLPPETGRLEHANRSLSFRVDPEPAYLPHTILLVIMESAGRDVPASDGDGMLRDRLIQLGGGESAGWVGFDNAVTNSNASNVAVPSLLTGTGAHEGIDKLHRMPFVFDMAKAHGYSTALVTSSAMDWAGFERFFSAAPIDDWVSNETLDKPVINDLTADDYYGFSAAADLLAKPGPVFLTLYTMSLHVPFQQTSLYDIPQALTDPLHRAAYIQQAGFAQIFDVLREAGRMENALIIVIGDHGEVFQGVHGIAPNARLGTFRGGILSPVFAVKLPGDMPEPMSRAVGANRVRLVSNADIAPTLAELLGVSLEGDLSYSGGSLFGDIPEDRMIFSLATSQWRNWKHTALAVSRGQERMLCETSDFCGIFDATGGTLRYERPAGAEDGLFSAALGEDQVRVTLAKLYWDYLREGGRPYPP